MKTLLPVVYALLLIACGSPDRNTEPAAVAQTSDDLQIIIDTARRIPNTTGWFEILKLPNDVYAIWEPGHAEKVNAFFILGDDKNVLYDTGMGIGNIGLAIKDLMKHEQLADRELMVINSHNHLDHNGGNQFFDHIWTINNKWALEKLTQGIAGGADGPFKSYWDQFTPHDGVAPPDSFDLPTFSIPPYPRENVSFLTEGDTVDLGNRQFEVIQARAHSPDGLTLYDKKNQVFFGGDTFLGNRYLITDLALLADDLDRVKSLPVKWHYSSHGPQLLEAMQHGRHLSVVRRMQQGEYSESSTLFAGIEMPLLELDGVYISLAGPALIY